MGGQAVSVRQLILRARVRMGLWVLRWWLRGLGGRP